MIRTARFPPAGGKARCHRKSPWIADEYAAASVRAYSQRSACGHNVDLPQKFVIYGKIFSYR